MTRREKMKESADHLSTFRSSIDLEFNHQHIMTEIIALIGQVVDELNSTDNEVEAGIEDYKATLEDHQRLVRKIDVILNGEEDAASQASLCDLVPQIRALVRNQMREPPLPPTMSLCVDLEAKLSFLLYNHIEAEDGTFCFPDGDIWRCKTK